MKNVIFLAMSTLYKVVIDEYTAQDHKTQTATVIKDCQSQLEPVVRYIMTQCKNEDVYVLSMATTDTKKLLSVGEERTITKKGFTSRERAVTQYKSEKEAKMGQEIGEKITTALDFFEDRIKSSEEYKMLASCSFDHCEIDLDKPEEAIQNSVKKIKHLKDEYPAEEIRLWIDTHGGLRDVALLINVVGYLLEEFADFKIAGVYGTETQNHRIIDQKNAFYSLAFVSGMSDFMNFGNVDVLKRYYESEISGGDEDIRKLVDAMQMVSDGTQFCDPYLYKEGLNALSDVIESQSEDSLQAEKALLPIFYDTIKKDYGNLLERERRSDIDIIERCMKKKQYQQALTFIEALMPEYFFEKRILYFSDEDKEKAEAATEKSYKSAISNVLDNFLEKVNNCFKHQEDVRNILAVKAGILAGAKKSDEFASDIEQILKKNHAPIDLSRGMKKNLKDSEMVVSIGEGNSIQYKSDISFVDRPRLIRVMQMHRVLKDSRNKFNHAVEGNAGTELSKRRPELKHVLTVMEKYIDEVRELEGLAKQDV